MDTSATYIKMCDCPEIQGERDKLRSIGDLWWFKGYGALPSGLCSFHRGKGKVVSGDWDEEDYLSESVAPEYFTWLPRQDQSQQMLYGKYAASLADSPFYLLHKVAKFAADDHVYPSPLLSMEQLWLAFVMKEKHGKVWDGKQWVFQRDDVKVTLSKSGETTRWKD
ncbi:MAG: hypothetical protein V3W37_06395 [Candidatus Binatia bacterium]